MNPAPDAGIADEPVFGMSFDHNLRQLYLLIGNTQIFVETPTPDMYRRL